MRALKALIWGGITVLLVVFLFQNGQVLLYEMNLKLALPGVTLHSAPIPLYALILGALFLGVLGAAIYCGLGTLRCRQAMRSLQRENESLRDELRSLRSPLIQPSGGVPETRSGREPGM
jgi:hypothetical protein